MQLWPQGFLISYFFSRKNRFRVLSQLSWLKISEIREIRDQERLVGTREGPNRHFSLEKRQISYIFGPLDVKKSRFYPKLALYLAGQ
ncbi:MAG: hypothetical protein EOM12_13260 [Verrucomicrobiae bacterium]|nr:hypothetical protein [Verrucomicrobiae bacterium]